MSDTPHVAHRKRNIYFLLKINRDVIKDESLSAEATVESIVRLQRNHHYFRFIQALEKTKCYTCLKC